MINLFYQEPDDDRWFPLDRFPRQVIRRLVRGKPRPGGHARVFLNLCAGFDRIGIPYRVNDYRYAKQNPNALACIIGKSFVLDKIEWKNPILLGPAVYSHPLDDVDLFQRLPVKKVLVPGMWMKKMCELYWGGKVGVWPVGIDTARWQSPGSKRKGFDVLLYDKVRWEHDGWNVSLIEPIRALLRKYRCSFREISYGFYQEEDFLTALRECKTMIFLCEHETQGIAYQQALSCGLPMMAWDRGGPWRDPAYYPEKVIFEPVTSVPYWDNRCGLRFKEFADFESQWDDFWEKAERGSFRPRDYILENLTLERSAKNYLEIVEQISKGYL